VSGFLEITLLLTAPLLLAASGELLLERSGSLQIGLEGTMLIGAFTAFAVARAGSGGSGSLVAGALAGLASGLLFALFAVALRADPILTGTAWNLLAAGVTGFGYRLVAGVTGAMLDVPSLRPTWLGLPPLVVAAFGLPFLLDFFLARTRPGLVLRAAGESPEGVKALGYSVVVVRSAASATAGVLAGLGGALLVLTVSGTFVEGVTAGRGFLALAIVVFARWKPLGLVPASLLVGGATSLQYRLQAGGSSIPYAVFLALPGLMSLAALAFTSSRGGAPKALGTEAP
jgi:general nucleoside transport system permease protein